MSKISKVLVIGSGPIIIGQAAEFDYSGTQACRALREEGVTTVLVNSNPATIMTDEGIADIVYIEPLTAEVLSRIIERERPDGLLPTMGGQTGLNLAVELADAGILNKYNVRLLGTPVETIKKAEERSLFKKLLIDISEPVPQSATVNSVEEARALVKSIGLPLIIRPSYTLGGTGGGIAYTMEELETIVANGLDSSMSREVLVEQCVLGWKEIEYEVMRDAADNCITICNMENVDPMGVHTGDSIVVAPSQTLTDKEYQMLRSASLRIIRALGIEGGCNIQFALTPHPLVAEKWAPDQKGVTKSQYYVIEVNPRVSRSSALASKATGYPIARLAAKIAIGKRLDEIPNRVTGKTLAFFEPALDYCVVKIPRWPFDKFALGDRTIGTQMKATGEAMAIDRCFEAALQKAVRSLEFGKRTLLWEDHTWKDKELALNLIQGLPLHPNDLRLWAIMAALRKGASVEWLSQCTGIDPWFIFKLQNIVAMEKRLLSESLTRELLWQAKRLGFNDEQVGTLADRLPEQVRQIRHEWQIRPVYKMVDTCAAEFDAETPYFYSTYETENEALALEGKKAVVIGSGPIRIGQGIEFDYCCVHSAWALREAGVKSILINSNPETVSTDFDTSSRLYFEALDEESIRDILENESNDGSAPPSIVQLGGQTPINLAQSLARSNMPILGSSADTIDIAEDRHRFGDFLDRLGVPQPPGGSVSSLDEAMNIANSLGYPLLVRPSYVLGGRAMEIVYNEAELVRYLTLALEVDRQHPVLIDKYMQGKEVEVDAICDGEGVFIPGVMEHIERAGVHSGDALAIYPGINLTEEEVSTIVDYTTRIGLALKIRGLMNVQMVIVRENGYSSVYVFEVNPRASRTVPFISKVTGVPVVRIATKVMLGISLKEQGYEGGLLRRQKLVGIKASVFSMAKLTGVDNYLGPEMKSTGEVLGIDYTFESALIKALIAAGLALPKKGGLLLSIADRDKAESLPLIKKLCSLNYILYATEGTAAMIESAGLPVKMVTKKLSQGHPNVIDVIQYGFVDGVVNTVTGGRIPLKDGFEIRRAAAEKRIPCFTSLDTFRVAIEALTGSSQIFNVRPLREYLRKSKSKS
ncbi:MAG: carbamoyl phosphate synthase large subunit [Chloroflexi bacterium CG_4_9_14_3_um_filter_45_9]|nr:MAG: carbamoyl phosphate synthase large subunit [Dehalococcoidia bacterium CG2_30_46_9]PIX27622.1 MAG: carbamoyl phosphate synthase large subunit [Chloroflexi bacterium CG_4_8_14_3_um_filter_45_15]PJB48543.1 MAG: carbamoyl phosphate synthase large subunit [Chloroflexi bacterium CG_4_9_14_3_um_filter_45_9]